MSDSNQMLKGCQFNNTDELKAQKPDFKNSRHFKT